MLATPQPRPALAGNPLAVVLGWLANGRYGVVGAVPVVLAT